jgi:hypothetical protein
MAARPTGERGNVLVTSMFLIAIMLGIGLAAMSQVDTQTAQSRKERVDESTFNLGEAALGAQVFVLGRKGAGTATKQYPDYCPSAGNAFCPDSATIAVNYDQGSQVDFDPATTLWRTWVRDNAPTATGAADLFWDDTLLARPRWDQNGDKLMWVRAQARVRGRERAMVGQIRIEPRPVTVPAYPILSGKFRTTNNGNHSAAIVDTGSSLGVAVRCNGSPPANGCIEYKPGRHIQPEKVSTGYAEGAAISQDDLDALLDVARANGTYYTSCPSSLTGDVVALDAGTSCKYMGNTQHNSLANPGMAIVVSGKIEFIGTTTYYGLVYHPNLSGSTDWDLVRVHGNAKVVGGVLVDGGGGIEAGSSGKLNISYSANAFLNINAFGTAGVVQNTWREISPMDLL